MVGFPEHGGIHGFLAEPPTGIALRRFHVAARAECLVHTVGEFAGPVQRVDDTGRDADQVPEYFTGDVERQGKH